MSRTIGFGMLEPVRTFVLESVSFLALNLSFYVHSIVLNRYVSMLDNEWPCNVICLFDFVSSLSTLVMIASATLLPSYDE